MKNKLLNKFNDKSGLIGIIGLGYVGFPLLLRYAEVGYRVLGIDIDPRKVESLNQGISYVKHIPTERLAAVANEKIQATTDFTLAKEADALILCVPTPLDKYREPDLSYVIDTFEALIPHLRPGQIISLESTTYPGTTDEELATRLEQAGYTIGEDIFLVYSPEREDPGNANFQTNTIPKICGGFTKHCLDVGIGLYRHAIDKVVPVSSTRAAEMTKLLENIHRAVNIG